MSITINNKDYELIETVVFDNKKYIVYSDNIQIYINEYNLNGNNLEILPITKEELKKLKKELSL